MRSEKEVYDIVLNFAKTDKRIRMVALVNKNWTQILLFSSVNIRLPYNAMLLLFLS